MLKEKYGIKVISALEPIAEDEGGEFYEMFLEWNAEKYSKRLSKRVKDGLNVSAANGTFCGGSLIFGYRLDYEPIPGKYNKFVKRIIIHEEEAKILRFVFEEYDKGVTKKKIAEALNAQGYRMKGKTITGKSFDRYLVNRKYTGEFSFGGRLCKNMYPAIIDKALFERVQQKLAQNRYTLGGAESAKEPYLLTGKLFCGHCGTEMVAGGGTSHTGKRYCYYACKLSKRRKCKKRLEHKTLLEEFVTDCVINFLKNPINAETVANDVFNYYNKRTEENNLKAVNTKIANAKNEVDKLTDVFINAKSKLLQDSIEKKMQEYEILLDNLFKQKAQLELERGYKLTKKDILDFIGMLLRGDPGDKDFRRQIIDNLVYRIYVSDNDTVIYFNIKGGSHIETITFDDNKTAVSLRVKVQTPLPPLRQVKLV
ncbi:MAG: recombinase family protein [Candidatus Borkfalkiaceae bacterium]|nr:recombinase family protein [Clostridia bacterium]MDY6223159.1 recombinase family protein [Christensenellaceae bacterium]